MRAPAESRKPDFMAATSMRPETTPTAEQAPSTLRRMMWRLCRFPARRKVRRAAQIPRLPRNPRPRAPAARLPQALPRSRTRLQRDGRELSLAARDRGHEQDFVAFPERVRCSAQKAYVLFVHIDVEEAPNLSLVVAQVRLERGKFLVEHRKKLSQVRSRAADRSH